MGTHIFEALQKEESFNLSVLSRKSSKSTFPPNIRVYHVDDDYPIDQLVEAFTGQDAIVSALPGRPFEVHLRMIDAAVHAGVKRFIPSEFGNNTCEAAADLVPMYADKAKVIAHLKTKESSGLTWTAIHSGQFFDWGVGSGWLDFQLEKKRVTIYDSGDKKWSTTNIETVGTAVVKVLLNPEETKNMPVFVASFTVSQSQVLDALEKATGVAWEVRKMSSAAALEKAKKLEDREESASLKLRVLMLLYADDKDRGANFEKDGLLSNDLLGLPAEDLSETIARVVRQQAS